MSLRPLEGYTVGITADRRWEEQAELLKRRGADVVHGPTITTHYLGDDEELRRPTAALIADPPDFLVATTGLGMRTWLEAAATWGRAEELRAALAQGRVVARGPKAAGAVQAAGLEVWSRSPTERIAEIVELLAAAGVEGRRVAIQEFGMASPGLGAALSALGADVVEVPVYRWRLPAADGPAARMAEGACAGRLHAITFTSAPAVHNLFRIAERHGTAERLRSALNDGVVAACVGPVCAAGAREEGIETPVVPEVGRLGLMVRALSDHLQPRRRALRLAGTDVVLQGSAVLVAGEAVTLAPLEQVVLDQLLPRPGAVISRTALLRHGWGSAHTDPHLLEATVARLRRRLGPAAPALQSVTGRGYRLVCDDPVRTASPADAGDSVQH
ncbi:MAG: uroporphyrinogen-III synthase [Acidimicrobiales bacterium]